MATDNEEYELPVDDSDELIEEEDEQEEEEGLDYDDDDNLALLYSKTEKGKEFLEKLGSEVVDDYDDDVKSMEEYVERAKDDWGLFIGELKKKDFPFKDCANAHIPILFENLLRITNRVSSELFGDYSRFLTVVPSGYIDAAAADIMTLHDNWQFREGIPDFQRQMDRGMVSFFMFGDVVGHSFYDEDRCCNRHEILGLDDFAVPYAHLSVMPDFSDLPRITKTFRYYEHQMLERKDKWNDVDKVIDRKPDDPETSEGDVFSIENARRIGHNPSDDNERAGAFKLLHQERRVSLPGKDRPRFCKVIVDHESKVVLELKVLEAVPAKEQQRFDREMQELEQYVSAMEQHQVLSEQFESNRVQFENVMSNMMVGELEKEGIRSQIEMKRPRPPNRPMWMKDDASMPEPPKVRPLHMFSHGVNVENLTGVFGLGQGRMLADHNRLSNTAMNQGIDSATLGNVWSLLVTDAVEFKDDCIIFRPGKVNKLKGFSGDDINKHVKEMRPAPANPQMFEIAKAGVQWGQEAMQSPDVLSGAPGKSGESFRGLNARIEQASKQISVPSRKYGRFFKQIAENNAALNSVYMKEAEVHELFDWRIAGYQNLVVRRDWYNAGYRFSFRTDFRFASEAQQVKEADELLQMPKALPPLAMNQAWNWEAAKRAIEARGKYDMVRLLGPQPPEPTVAITGQPPPPPAMPAGVAGPAPRPAGPGQQRPPAARPRPPQAGPQ